MLPQQYCLRWKYHHSNLQTMFSQLLDRGCFCDVTLACEGQTIKAHRVVLCACSTYFDAILTNCCSEKDPIIIMKDAKFSDVKCLIEFMYKGEINVEHGSLASLLKTAEELKIKGLAEVSWREDENSTENDIDTLYQQQQPQIYHSPISDSPLQLTTTGHHHYSPTNYPLQSPNHLNNNNNCSLITNQMDSELQRQQQELSQSITTSNHIRRRSLVVSPMPMTASTTTATITTASTTTSSTVMKSDCGDYSEPSELPLLAPIATLPKDLSSTILHTLPFKKKRGRPPLDGEFDTYSAPKTSHLDNVNSHLVNVMMDENSKDDNNQLSKQQQQQNQQRQQIRIDTSLGINDTMSWAEQNLDTHMDYDDDEPIPNIIPKLERSDLLPDDDMLLPPGSPSEMIGSQMSQPLMLTQQELEEWQDVVKMNDYLVKGRRPQFWDEPFTKRVMDAIKNKDLEMKKAAQILGVSYGTLYGRYRETYGCLKHPYRGPFMVSRLRDMWPEHGTSEIIGMLQRGIITLPRAAELMNTSPITHHDWSLLGDRDLMDMDDHPSREKKSNHKHNNQKTLLTLPNHPEVSLINVKKPSYSNNNNNNTSSRSSTSSNASLSSTSSSLSPQPTASKTKTTSNNRTSNIQREKKNGILIPSPTVTAAT